MPYGTYDLTTSFNYVLYRTRVSLHAYNAHFETLVKRVNGNYYLLLIKKKLAKILYLPITLILFDFSAKCWHNKNSYEIDSVNSTFSNLYFFFVSGNYPLLLIISR